MCGVAHAREVQRSEAGEHEVLCVHHSSSLASGDPPSALARRAVFVDADVELEHPWACVARSRA